VTRQVAHETHEGGTGRVRALNPLPLCLTRDFTNHAAMQQAGLQAPGIGEEAGQGLARS
jgi:hypothetical protein